MFEGTYVLTKKKLDDYLNAARNSVLIGLVKDGLLSDEDAIAWSSKNHPVVTERDGVSQVVLAK